MKRTLVIIMLAVLLLSTVGATVAVAKDNQPAGKSNVWQQSVTIYSDDGSTGHGKFVLNTKQHTFTFAGEGCSPGGSYRMWYDTSAGTRIVIGSVAADSDGTLHTAGVCSATPADLASLSVNTLRSGSLNAVQIVATYDSVNDWYRLDAGYTGQYSGILKYEWKQYNSNNELQADGFAGGSINYPAYNAAYNGWYMVVTVTDAIGNTATSAPWYQPNV